jgi:hypothetical protein
MGSARLDDPVLREHVAARGGVLSIATRMFMEG